MRKTGEHSNIYNHILKCIGLFGSVQGLIALGTFVRSVIIARLIGQVGYGLNESFNRTINLAKSATDLGVGFSAVKKISEYYSDNNPQAMNNAIGVVRSWAFLTAIIGSVIAFALAPLFSMWAFKNSDYTASFMMLSPMVAFAAVMGGEMAVLKATRMIKQAAMSQLFSAIAAILVSVPLIWKMRLEGLVPSLVIVSFAGLVITACYSFHAYPYRLKLFSKHVYSSGVDMIKLGICFTVSTFLSAGAYSIISNWMSSSINTSVTGVYSISNLLISYLGLLVFSAVDSDYFPRLSTLYKSNLKIRVLAIRQSEVSLILITPLVLLFFFGIPVFIDIFFPNFKESVPIAQLMAVGLVFKSVTMPVAYISLVKSDSKVFLIQEFLFDAFLVAAVIGGYKIMGMWGIGAAFALAGLFDWIIVSVIAYVRYRYCINRQLAFMILVQSVLVFAGYIVLSCCSGPAYWGFGLTVCCCSCLYSYYCYRKRS